MRRIVLAMTGAACLLIVAGAAFLLSQQTPERPAPAAALNIGGADIGGPFTLVDHTGEERTSASLIQGPTLLYFGYTYCPDVCPIDTQVMVDIVDVLDEKGIQATPVFITVDPARDDVESMAIYAEIMHPKMIAMTGSDDQIATAAKAYKAYYQRVETDSAADYLMNHSAYLYLVDPDGLQAMYRRGFAPEEIAEDIAWVLDR
ncbi:MAG: SCO family protein [Pseudomonadota bacterium]